MSTGPNVLMISQSSCPSMLGIWKDRDPEKSCKLANDEIAAFLGENPAADVLLVSAWNDLASNFRDEFRIQDEELRPVTAEEVKQVFARSLQRTVSTLGESRDILILSQPPRFPLQVDSYVIRQHLLSQAFDPLVTREQQLARTGVVLAALPSAPNLHFLNFDDVFCAGADCAYQREGVPMFSDAVHLNSTGAELLVSPLMAQLSEWQAHEPQAEAPIVALVEGTTAALAPTPASAQPGRDPTTLTPETYVAQVVQDFAALRRALALYHEDFGAGHVRQAGVISRMA